MKYPEDFVNKIICGDCLEVMKTMPDKCVDLVVTSPPYNQALTTQDKSRALYSDNIDEIDYITMLTNCFSQFRRILKDKGSLFYNYKTNVKSNVLSPAFRHLEKVNSFSSFLLVGEIVWNYAGNFDSAKTRFPTDYEMIYHLAKQSNYNFYHQGEELSSVWNYKHVMGGSYEKQECGNHPCPYPKNMIGKIIRYTTQESNVVLDPFMGSGTTAVACKENKRMFIGCELREDYIKIAMNRLQNTMGSLF